MNNSSCVIIGGGYLGLMSALALAGRGIAVTVLERGLFDGAERKSGPCKLFAISNGSMRSIERLCGLSLNGLGQNINHIRILEHGTSAFIDFEPESLGMESFGIMIEERDLYALLLEKVRLCLGVELISEALIASVCEKHDKAVVELKGGRRIEADIALVCDGRNSHVRSLLGIEVVSKGYGQSAIICDVGHQFEHGGVAAEIFTSQGPFAILPNVGGHQSSIVWTLEHELANTVLQLDGGAQLAHIAERFGDYLGELRLLSPLKAYPLSLCYARTYSCGRFYLLGDALHAIHPLAGQGLNLSVRDLEFIEQQIEQSLSLGLDIGCNASIAQYLKARYMDNHTMICATDTLNALFSNANPLAKLARTTGMHIFEGIPQLKNCSMLYAAGLL